MGLRAHLNRRSIEVRVLVLQGAGWLSLLLLVAVTVASSSRQLADLAASRQQQLADLVAHQLDQIIAGDLARVQALSGSARAGLADNPATPARTGLVDAFHRATLIESIRVLDRTGTVILQEPARALAQAPGTDEVDQAFATGRIRALSLSEAPLRADILIPLRGPQGSIDMVAGVVLNAQSRAVRDLLAAAGAELVPAPASGGPSGPPASAAVRALLAVAPWAVLPSAKDARVSMDVAQTLWWSLPISLLLALVFAWGTAHSVRRPILALTSAAERMAGGDLETPLPGVAEGDEVGRLAVVLERLRLALHRDAWRRQTLRKVISAQEEERRRIARELHDDTAQALAAVGVSLEAALEDMPVTPARWRLESLKVLVNQSLTDLHRVIYDLRPSVLDDLGLAAGVRWLAEEHLRRTGVPVRVECYGLEDRLPPDIETAVFRVVQEALANVERHAAAETVLLQVSREGSALTLEVEDDGRGFDPSTVERLPGSARGLGLQGMRERLELLGGSFSLVSAPERGTRVFAKVPL